MLRRKLCQKRGSRRRRRYSDLRYFFASQRGRAVTFEVYYRPTAFPLDAVICDADALETARALSLVTAVGFPAQAIRIAFREDAGFARCVAETLANEKRRSTLLRKTDRLLTAAQMVAHWALEGADNQTGRIDIPVSKHVLAAHLSMAPANLSRTLAMLNQHGLLNRGQQLYILDRKKLEEFAKVTSSFQI